MSRVYEEQTTTNCAATQWGVISRARALDAGLTRNSIHRHVKSGRWKKVLPGVYRVAGAPKCWQQDVIAAVLWAGEGAVASHSCAGAVFGLNNFKPGRAEISFAGSLRPNGLPVTVHRVRSFGPADRMVYRGIPVTSAARMVVDLAGELDLPALVRLIDDCLRRKLFTFTRLRWQVKQTGKKPGVPLLRKVLENPVMAHSVLERKMLDLLESASLPAPVMQLPILESAKLIGRVDFAYPDKKLVIETDGRWFHFGDEKFEEDRQRRNALESRGWRVLNLPGAT